jgi:hypothetical protein
MSRYNLSKPRPAPEPPYRCELVEIDVEAVPYMLGALWQREQRYHWLTADDAKRGRQLLAKEGAQLLMGCTREITNRQDALYALLDRAINGTEYSVSGAGTDVEPYIWAPPLPTAPGPVYALPGLLRQAEISGRQLDNLTNGTTYDEAPDSRNIRQQLEDLIAALGEQESLDPEILAELVQILAALA